MLQLIAKSKAVKDGEGLAEKVCEKCWRENCAWFKDAVKRVLAETGQIFSGLERAT